MKIAINEAKIAFEEDEIPVGAVIVYENQVIARGHNQSKRLNDSTAHAEMIAITSAQNTIGSRYLNDCELYVTLEPCVMCAGALFWAKIGKVVYGARDEKEGAFLIGKNIMHPKTKIKGGILMGECAYLLTSFFEKKRKLDKKN